MELLKELILKKIIHMQTVSTKLDPKFRVDSIALALNHPEDDITAYISDLANDQIINYHPPQRHSSNHATSNFGEVSLNITVDEAKKLLQQQSHAM